MYLSNLQECEIDLPKMIWFGSEGDDIEEVRHKLMRGLIDRKQFDVFLESQFGKYLLEGIHNEDLVEKQGITKVSQFIHKQGSYWKATQRAKLDACNVQSNSSLQRKKASPAANQRQRKASQNRKTSQTREEFYKEYMKKFEMQRFSHTRLREINSLVKECLLKLQSNMKLNRGMSFEQVIQHLEDQGPIQEVTDNK